MGGTHRLSDHAHQLAQQQHEQGRIPRRLPLRACPRLPRTATATVAMTMTMSMTPSASVPRPQHLRHQALQALVVGKELQGQLHVAAHLPVSAQVVLATGARARHQLVHVEDVIAIHAAGIAMVEGVI